MPSAFSFHPSVIGPFLFFERFLLLHTHERVRVGVRSKENFVCVCVCVCVCVYQKSVLYVGMSPEIADSA